MHAWQTALRMIAERSTPYLTALAIGLSACAAHAPARNLEPSKAAARPSEDLGCVQLALAARRLQQAEREERAAQALAELRDPRALEALTRAEVDAELANALMRRVEAEQQTAKRATAVGAAIGDRAAH
jgi:hypothetical protein